MAKKKAAIKKKKVAKKKSTKKKVAKKKSAPKKKAAKSAVRNNLMSRFSCKVKCTVHGLLGKFSSESEAEDCAAEHKLATGHTASIECGL